MGDSIKIMQSHNMIREHSIGLISLFYAHHFPVGERCAVAEPCSDAMLSLCSLILSQLKLYSVSEIIDIIKTNFNEFDIKPSDIPQFSSFDDAIFRVPYLTLASGLSDIGFSQMGFMLLNSPKKEGAYMKYGENHAKTAAQLGLCSVQKGKINPSYLGVLFTRLSKEEQNLITPKLLLYAPLVQNFFALDMRNDLMDEYFSTLSDSTRKRRWSNVKTLINIVGKSVGYEL